MSGNNELERRLRQVQARTEELIAQRHEEQSRIMAALQAILDLVAPPADRRRETVKVVHEKRSGSDRRKRQVHFDGPDKRRRETCVLGVFV